MTFRKKVLIAATAVLAMRLSADATPVKVTQFAGWWDFSSLGPAKRRLVEHIEIRTAKQWKQFLAGVPKLVPRDRKAVDTPNSDPVLKARIDWTKQRVVVVRSRSAVPDITAIKPGKKLVIQYTLRTDFSSRPSGWGRYSARIIAAGKTTLRFDRARQPAAPRRN